MNYPMRIINSIVVRTAPLMPKFISSITFFLVLTLSSTLQSHPSSFADLVENLSPAVVSIASTTIVKDNNNSQNQMPRFPEGSPFDEFFKEYFDRQQRNAPNERPMIGLGSGFIIDTKGIVVTNNHVIQGAEAVSYTHLTLPTKRIV